MKSIGAILISPLLCLGILAGIEAESATHLNPADAEPYHARAKQTLGAIPYTIGSWGGKDSDVPQAAVKLLRPNFILSRHYIDRESRGRDWADVLIVQCQDSRDMVGHYPKQCYSQSGAILVEQRDRDWKIGPWTIPGVEYHFEKSTGRRPERFCVYNFMVVPGRGVVRDIDGVNKAAEDYQRRHFGAAQFQFLMRDDVSQEQHDAWFNELMGDMLEPLRVLLEVDVDKRGDRRTTVGGVSPDSDLTAAATAKDR